jgi:hypothetical protein
VKRQKIIKNISVFLLVLLSFACQNATEKPAETKTENTSKVITETKQTPNVSPTVNVSNSTVDLAKLIGKKPVEIESILGKPLENKEKGAFQLYKLADEPKGLAVRFLGGRAVNFNLISSKSFATSQEAILKSFGIDVGKIPPIRNANEPLTERFQGMFNGIKFDKISAKKDEKTNQFIFVLAEVKEEDLPKKK